MDASGFNDLKSPAATELPISARSGPPAAPEALEEALDDVPAPPLPEVAAQREDAPRRPSGEDVFAFEVALAIDEQQGSGLRLLREEGIPAVLVVSEVDGEGPVAAWNAANDALAVQRGDRIVAVSGQSCEQLVDLTDVQQEGDLTVAVQRWPECYQIKLERKNSADKLGMNLELVERAGGERTLRISQIGPGMMSAWNAAALAEGRPHVAVSPGTHLVQVGALGDNHEAMMTALQSGDVDLTLRRPDLRAIERREAKQGGAAPGA